MWQTSFAPKELISAHHPPQQKRVAEQKNQHIEEVARAMMNEKNLPKSYRAEPLGYTT